LTLSKRMARTLFMLYAVFGAGVATFPAMARAQLQAAIAHDGARDFDWEIGTWETQVQVRAPLDAGAAWAEFRGTSVVQAFSDGRTNLVDLNVTSGDRRIEGVSLRLYNPQARQWSLNFASMRDGTLTAPVFGAFVDGRGVFYGQDTVDGRVVMVRFVISDITVNSARFVQSYSDDGGQSWIDNWIAVDTRR
jgi:hypothetical protein